MRIKISGFQSHKDTDINLTGNYICIVGPNNSGKSAIRRALQSLFYDGIHGPRYIKSGMNESRISVELDGHEIQRIKSKTKNAYIVDGQPFDSIGSGVLPEVSKITNIFPVVIDKDIELNLNIPLQSDSPFLMAENGTLKIKILNALTGHHILDIALRDTVTKVKQINQEIASFEDSVQELTEQLKEFEGLEEADKKLASAKHCFEKLNQKVEYAKEVRNVLQAYLGLEEARTLSISQQLFKDLTPALSRLETLKALADSVQQLSGITGQLSQLRLGLKELNVDVEMAKLERLRELKEAMQQASNIGIAIGKVRLDIHEVDITPLLERAQNLQELNSGIHQVRTLISEESRLQEQLRSIQDGLSALSGQMSEFIGTACSACGQPITETCFQEVA